MGPPLRGARRCAQRARSAALARRRGAVCHRRPPVVAAAGAESATGPVGSGAVRREPLRVTRPGVDGRSGVALWSRPSDAAPFIDPWALALYGYLAGTALAARRWGAGLMDSSTARWTARGGELLWVLCGAAVFAGGSVELQRYFGRRAPLAGDLALSVFWLAYAGALVRLGFQLDRKDVRSAGLAVAAGAGLKIVLYDLSNLDALYRIASFFTLALIALAVAYAYNKRAKASAT